MDDVQFEKDLDLLNEESKLDVSNIREIVQRIVPTYHPSAN